MSIKYALVIQFWHPSAGPKFQQPLHTPHCPRTSTLNPLPISLVSISSGGGLEGEHFFYLGFQVSLKKHLCAANFLAWTCINIWEIIGTRIITNGSLFIDVQLFETFGSHLYRGHVGAWVLQVCVIFINRGILCIL